MTAGGPAVRAGVVHELRVAGHLDPRRADRLGGLQLRHAPDGSTTLTGPVLDQAQLHGILGGIRDMGADLLALSRHPARPVPPAVRTARLTLRPATPDDAEAAWAYRRLPGVARWLTQGPADLRSDPETLAATLVIERDGRVIGDLTLRRRDARAQDGAAGPARDAEAELGWVLDPAHRGRGYATEAVRALIRTAFDDLGLRRVTATSFRDDHASRRVAERAGMHREAHHVRAALHRSGRWLDTLTHAALPAAPPPH